VHQINNLIQQELADETVFFSEQILANPAKKRKTKEIKTKSSRIITIRRQKSSVVLKASDYCVFVTCSVI
jgi:hypothetical protein